MHRIDAKVVLTATTYLLVGWCCVGCVEAWPIAGADCPCPGPDYYCCKYVNKCISRLQRCGDIFPFRLRDEDWVELQPGTFMMGSPAGQGDSDEHPQHQVRIGYSFLMKRTEATVAEYRGCVEAGSCTPPQEPCERSPPLWSDRPSDETDSFPVNCVTWKQAEEFCAWADARLPTEAEWEYAASSQGKIGPYPWGDAEPTCAHVVTTSYLVEGDDCARGGPLPVCSKVAGNTAQGLCDMAGNVQEMIIDLWNNNYDGAPEDGSVWETGFVGYHPRRGGGWEDGPNGLRVSDRFWGQDPDLRGDRGIRCVKPIVEASE